MAKTLEINRKEAYGYPSRFGSHSSMVNIESTERLRGTRANAVVVDDVVLTDEYGDYITESKRLDDHTADPNRYASSRLGRLYEKSAKEKDKR